MAGRVDGDEWVKGVVRLRSLRGCWSQKVRDHCETNSKRRLIVWLISIATCAQTGMVRQGADIEADRGRKESCVDEKGLERNGWAVVCHEDEEGGLEG